MAGIFQNLKDKIAQHIEVRVQLFKLSFIERTSNVLSYILFIMVALFLALAVLLFVGFGLAEALSYWLDSRIGGYFAAGGIYFFVLLIVLLLRKQVAGLFANIFVNVLTGDNEQEKQKQTGKE